MRLIFCVREHTFDEIYMGHMLGFSAIHGVDVISATANARGFTPLTAVARTYGWKRELIEVASDECNRRGEVAVLGTLTPELLLVPKTKGDGGRLPDADHLMLDLLAAVNDQQFESLHFTHFGFLQGRLPVMEMRRILEVLLNPLEELTLNTLYWDIDQRGQSALVHLHETVVRQYRLIAPKPEIFVAPTYEWQEVQKTSSGNTAHELISKKVNSSHRVH